MEYSSARSGGRLFLFDIDGTLLRKAPPVHRVAISVAARAVYGIEISVEGLGVTAGMTDSAIARRALRLAGLADDVITEGLPAFFAEAATVYERSVPDDLSAYRTPHAAETLAWVAARGMALGLVTGNIERIARAKLRAAGLLEWFERPEAVGGAWIGAFGDEAEDRNALPPLALRRARRALGVARGLEAWIVGDTPADVACGQAHGLGVIAVATGPVHSRADLLACGPDYTLDDLSSFAALALWDADEDVVGEVGEAAGE